MFSLLALKPYHLRPFLYHISGHHHFQLKNQSSTPHHMTFLTNRLDFCYKKITVGHPIVISDLAISNEENGPFQSLFARKIFKEPNWLGFEFLFFIFFHLHHWPPHRIRSGTCEFHPFLEWVSYVFKFQVLCFVVEKNHVVLKP